MNKQNTILLMVAVVAAFLGMAVWSFSAWRSTNLSHNRANTNVVNSTVNTSVNAEGTSYTSEKDCVTRINKVCKKITIGDFGTEWRPIGDALPAGAVVKTAADALFAADKNEVVQTFKKNAAKKDFAVSSYAIYHEDTKLWSAVYYVPKIADYNLEARVAADGTVTETKSEGG